jgi:anthranilate synthase component 2
MILLIDNYDSFTYNLYQMVGSLIGECADVVGEAEGITVARNDAITVEEIEVLAPTHIILSPGPGRPEDAAVCPEAIRRFAGRVPLLGVCLGHQAICQVFGATITYAERLMHGKASQLLLEPGARLFAGLPAEIQGARYHSLAVNPASVPAELAVTARTAAGEVMAVEHCELPVFGLQFHPESILTPEGATILANFLKTVPLRGER